MKTAVFLGAGASAAEGAPIQNDLFKRYFKSVNRRSTRVVPGKTESAMKAHLSDFFKEMFDINVAAANLDKVTFPTFEEALGLLDLAELRREAFKRFELEPFGWYGDRIRLVRELIVLAMAKAIHDSLKRSKHLHRDLVHNLKNKHLLPDTVFITTNYDILIDNAISSLSPTSPGANLDYGVEFLNSSRGEWVRPNPQAVPLYKLHGSLNWLYCPTCNGLTLTPYVKGVVSLITDMPKLGEALCRSCSAIMTPIIVPPTFYKDMSRVFLGVIWNKAESVLREAEHIIFCGYSFPDADIHIKYLLKRVQTNRPNAKTLRFSVINHYKGKKRAQVIDEKERFMRFLGKNVSYKTALPPTPTDFTNRPSGVAAVPARGRPVAKRRVFAVT